MLIQAPAPAPIILPIPGTCLTDNSESQNRNFYSFKREHSNVNIQHKQIPPHKTCLKLNPGHNGSQFLAENLYSPEGLESRGSKVKVHV